MGCMEQWDMDEFYDTICTMKTADQKVAYLGEDVQRAAKEKFQKINEAYEAIKKQRGFS